MSAEDENVGTSQAQFDAATRNLQPEILPPLPEGAAASEAGGANGVVGSESPSGVVSGGWPVSMVTTAVAFPFDLLASRRGEHWQLNEVEKETLGELWAQFLNLWFPVDPKNQKYMALILCLGTTGAAIQVRLEKDKPKKPASSPASIRTAASEVAPSSPANEVPVSQF